MNQLERIRHMESIMDRAEEILSALGKAVEDYQAAESEINELENYYSSDLWREDFDADSAGKLPEDLKRGILSEDGIWNLLAERDSLRQQMNVLGKSGHDSEE